MQHDAMKLEGKELSMDVSPFTHLTQTQQMRDVHIKLQQIFLFKQTELQRIYLFAIYTDRYYVNDE